MAKEKIKPQDETIPSDFKDAELEEEFEEDTERGERRKGGAFDTLARVLRGVVEMRFINDFVIKNRPSLGGTAVRVKNMFEGYYQKPSDNGINAIIFGRKGDGNFRNNHLIELAVNHRTAMSNDQGPNNGAIKLRVTREGENPDQDNSGITVADAGTLGKTAGTTRPGVICRVIGNGEYGGVLLTFINDKGTDVLARDPVTKEELHKYPTIVIYNAGTTGSPNIQMEFKNLPTSDPGGSNRVWKNGNTLSIT